MSSTTSNAVAVEIDGKPERSPLTKSSGNISPIIVALIVGTLCVGGTGLSLSIYLMGRVTELEGRADTFEARAIVSDSPHVISGYDKTVSLLAGAGAWAPGVNMPQKRSDLQAVRCGNDIIVLGGLNATNGVVDTVWAFDPIFETFNVSKVPMPTGRYRFGAACLGDRYLYVAGGFDSSETGSTGESLASVDVYDVVTDAWASGPTLLAPRGDLALAALGETLHAIGGYDHEYNERADHQVLDLAAEIPVWKAGVPMPTAKGDLQAAVIDNNIYVPGGWNVPDHFLSELAVYDPTTDQWELKTPMRSARGDGAVVAHDGKMFMIGGEMWSGLKSACDWGWDGECAVNLIPMHGVEMYDPQEDTWTQMAPLPASRFRFAASAVEGRDAEGGIFVFGGHMHGEVAVDSQYGFHYVPKESVYVHIKD